MVELDHRTFLRQDFGIVNPLQVDMSLWQHLSPTPLGAMEFDCELAQLPHLLCLREADELTRLRVLDCSEAFTANEGSPFFSALIRTSETPTALTRRLSRQLVLKRESNQQRYLFRYFDPRVFLHLPSILTSDEMQALLRPAGAWTWFNPLLQTWCEHEIQPSTNEAVPAVKLKLTSIQLDRVARIEVVNRALRRLQHEQPQHRLTDQSLESTDNIAQRAIEEEHLAGVDDQVQYVLDALHFGPQVHRTSIVRQVLDRTRDGETSYAAGMNALGDPAVRAALQALGATTSR